MSESWSSWRGQIEQAMAYLMSPEMGDHKVQIIVETQLLLSVYMRGRKKMHLLYKVCRADNPQALCQDFKSEPCDELRSYAQVQTDALKRVKQFLKQFPQEVNHDQPNKKGTVLWAAAEQGHVEAVRELLLHPHTNPNQARLSSRTTPLFIASLRGHEEVVEALLGHADIDANLGAIESGISPLCIAVQEGREGVVEILLRHGSIEVNKAERETGVTPLCKASQMGYEHIVELLLAAHRIDVHCKTHSGATALSCATREGHAYIIELISAKSPAQHREQGLLATRKGWMVEKPTDKIDKTKCSQTRLSSEVGIAEVEYGAS
jgi:hypothetical protein